MVPCEQTRPTVDEGSSGGLGCQGREGVFCEGCEECVCFIKEERSGDGGNEEPLKALWNAIAVKTEAMEDEAKKTGAGVEVSLTKVVQGVQGGKLPRGHHVKYDRAFQDRAREGQEHWNKMLKGMREEWKQREIAVRFNGFGLQMEKAQGAMVKAQKVRTMCMRCFSNLLFDQWFGFVFAGVHPDVFTFCVCGWRG